MGDVLLGARVLAVEVAVVGEQFGGRHLPGAVVLLALAPPGQAGGELLELDRLGLGVVLPALGQGVLVVPDFLGRAGAVEEQQVRGDGGVGREDAVGQAHDGVEVELLEQLLLDAGADAVAEERAVGHDHGGAAGRPAGGGPARSLRMMSCRKSSAVSAVCLSSGKLPWMPFSSSPPKGGLVRITSTRSFSPISVSLKRRRVAGVDLRGVEAVQEQVHLAEQVGQRLGLAAEERALLEDACGRPRSCTCLAEVGEGLDQEAAGAAGGVEDGLAQARVGDRDHEAHHRPGGVELAGVAGGVAHLPEHGLVEAPRVWSSSLEVKWMPVTLLMTSRSR